MKSSMVFGVNGGWVMGIMPACEVNALCDRFYREKGCGRDGPHCFLCDMEA